MKRSEVNRYIDHAKNFFASHQFLLPPFAFYPPAEWQRLQRERDVEEILDLRLGWDITDNCSGRFESLGLLLFTIRNGKAGSPKYPKSYAEKILLVRENQVTPMHFHWQKAEDLINRGGGELHVQVYDATPDDDLAKTPVSVVVDGERRIVPAGSWVILRPGESITMTSRLYHSFHAEKGMVMVGEVSSVNDDQNDNRFYESFGRFPEITEDEPPTHLLCTDYEKFLVKRN